MRIVSLTGLLFLPIAALAHHAVAGFFDPGEPVELEGTVTDIVWRNPHTEFRVDVTDEAGQVTNWRIESGALGVLRARGLDQRFLQVGDFIRILGDASLRGEPETFARNLLLSDGTEVLLTVGSTEYFSTVAGAALYEPEYDDDVEERARRSANGIFRVWSTNIEELPTSGGRMFHGDYPLSPEAELERSRFDLSDESLLGCTDWNMPRLMNNPLPMEFVRHGDDILLRLEEDDNERLIHMGSDAEVPGADALLGHSTGRWDGDSLVVETTGIAAGRLDGRGTPFSASIHLLERFTPSQDGSRLDYRITITDPNTFSEPFELGRYWIWRPEIEVGEYRCEEAQ